MRIVSELVVVKGRVPPPEIEEQGLHGRNGAIQVCINVKGGGRIDISSCCLCIVP